MELIQLTILFAIFYVIMSIVFGFGVLHIRIGKKERPLFNLYMGDTDEVQSLKKEQKDEVNSDKKE